MVVWPCALLAQQPRRLTAVPEFRVDATDTDLSPIGFMLVGRDSTIFVTQSTDGVIRWFSPNGTSGKIGRKGGGPGEFQGLTRIGWRGDSIWALDPSLSRISIVGPDRKFVRSFPQPLETSSGGVAAAGLKPFVQAVLADGNLRAIVPLLANAKRPPWAADVDSGALLVAKISPSGTLLNRMFIVPRSECQANFSFDNGKGSGSLTFPLCAETVLTYWSGGERVGIVSASSRSFPAKTYRVSVVDPDGKTRFDVARQFTPVPVPRKTADSVVAERRKFLPASVKNLNIPTPAFYPPVTRIVLGRDDTVWLEVATGKPGRTWHMLDGVGRAVGEVTLPANVRLQLADRNTIWALERDEDDVESIVRYRLK